MSFRVIFLLLLRDASPRWKTVSYAVLYKSPDPFFWSKRGTIYSCDWLKPLAKNGMSPRYPSHGLYDACVGYACACCGPRPYLTFRRYVRVRRGVAVSIQVKQWTQKGEDWCFYLNPACACFEPRFKSRVTSFVSSCACGWWWTYASRTSKRVLRVEITMILLL